MVCQLGGVDPSGYGQRDWRSLRQCRELFASETPDGGLKETGFGGQGPPNAVDELTGTKLVVTYLPLAIRRNGVAAIWRRGTSLRSRNKMKSSDQLVAVPSSPVALQTAVAKPGEIGA